MYAPFRPNHYESSNEKRYFVLDLVRCLIGVVMAFILIMIPVCNMRQLKQFNRSDFSEVVIELCVLVIFLVQLFLMTSASDTSDFFDGRNSEIAIDSSY